MKHIDQEIVVEIYYYIMNTIFYLYHFFYSFLKYIFTLRFISFQD